MGVYMSEMAVQGAGLHPTFRGPTLFDWKSCSDVKRGDGGKVTHVNVSSLLYLPGDLFPG
jgi:hypothetical protein